jgi:hypothetical protein
MGPTAGVRAGCHKNARLDGGRLTGRINVTIDWQGPRATAEQFSRAVLRQTAKTTPCVMQRERLASPSSVASAGLDFTVSGCHDPMAK